MPIPLAQLPIAPRKRTGKPTTYAVCYRGVVDGVFPATKSGRCWFIDEADLPAIAVTLGLAPAAPAIA